MASYLPSGRATGVSENVGAVAFLGTPFEGSNKAQWAGTARILMKLLRLSNDNKELLDNLEPRSSSLATLSRDFPLWLAKENSTKKINVMCFYEEGDSSVGKIVSQQSASIQGQESLSLHSDHIGMCKFSNAEDANYKTVMQVLRGWVDELKRLRANNDETKVRLAWPNSPHKYGLTMFDA